jgi:uncharacterized protein (DUF58 family)
LGTWLAIGVLVVGSVAVVAASWLSPEPGSAFAAGGGGIGALVEDADLQGLKVERLVAGPLGLSHDAGLDPTRTVLVVATPKHPYSTDEAAAAMAFVARGGVLLVADDFGQANSLTASMGLVFERVRLVEPDPSASTNASVAGRTYSLALTGATGLKAPPSSATRVLAWSSEASFLDRDGDGIIGPADPHGPFPLIAESTPAGASGHILAVADVDIFSRSGSDLKDNRAWRQAILAQALPDGGTVLVDESQVASDPGLRILGIAVAAAAAPPWRYALMSVTGLLILGLVSPFIRERWQAHRFRPHRFIRRSTLAARLGPAAPEPHGSPRSHWTARGVAAILAMGALVCLSLLFGSNEAGYAGGALLAALAMAAVPRLPRLEAQRRLSVDRLDEASEAQVSLEVKQGMGSHVDLEFRDHLPDEFEVRVGTPWFRARLPNRQPLAVSYAVSPALRGPYDIGPLHVRLKDPLALRVQEAHLAGGTAIRVNPRKEPVRKVPFRTRVPTITLGPHLVNRAGDGSEFHALRTYQTGDSYRNVNWKASARSKELMVNQRVHESMARLAIFVDARAISGAGPASLTPLAQGCRAALSVAAGALRVRDRIRIVVYGEGVLELPPAPGSRQLHELTELLAGLPAAGSTPFLEAVRHALPTLKGGTPAMLASGLEDDPSIVEGMKLLRARGLLPFAVVPSLGTQPLEPDDGGPEPEAASLTEARRQAIGKLQSIGVPVYDAVPNVPLDYLFRTGGGL